MATRHRQIFQCSADNWIVLIIDSHPSSNRISTISILIDHGIEDGRIALERDGSHIGVLTVGHHIMMGGDILEITPAHQMLFHHHRGNGRSHGQRVAKRADRVILRRDLHLGKNRQRHIHRTVAIVLALEQMGKVDDERLVGIGSCRTHRYRILTVFRIAVFVTNRIFQIYHV